MRIAVHGLLQKQQAEMRKRYGNSVEFYFFDNQKMKINGLPDQGVPLIIVTKFSSHQHIEKLTSWFRRSIRLPSSHGLSGVCREVDQLLKENT